MYAVNPFYLEALQNDNKRYQCRINLGENLQLINEDISSLKFDQSLIENDKFSIGGVHAATISLTLLNYEGKLDNINFDNKEFDIRIKLELKELYTVVQVDESLVNLINTISVKSLSSLWIPIGKFYPTEIKKNNNLTISIKLTDKTKYMDDEYVSTLNYPATLKQVRNEIYSKLQIQDDTETFLNEDEVIDTKPEGYSYMQILRYIAECAFGYEVINRQGHGELRQFSSVINKTIEKGVFKEFIPAESYIIIKRIKYFNGTIGEESGHTLELDDQNPFVTDTIAQNLLNKIRNFTYITYSFKAVNGDVAVDCGDKISMTNSKNVEFISFITSNSWEFNGQIAQDWSAKGESELNNSYSTKGYFGQTIERIQKEQIPSVLEAAIEQATELLTNFNGGYVIKKDGELFISDNEDIDKAEHIWRWNLNGLGYSSTGIGGPYRISYDNGWIYSCIFYYVWIYERR